MIGRANPLARIGAALALLMALFVSLDAVTAAVIIALDLAVAPLVGVDARRLAIRAGPLLAVAAVIGLSNGFVAAGGPSVQTGVALGLRVFAVGFTGLLAVLPTDPTDLADALMQDMHLSPRLALSTLASLRLAPLVADDWRTLGLARQEDDGRGVPGAERGQTGARRCDRTDGGIRRAVLDEHRHGRANGQRVL